MKIVEKQDRVGRPAKSASGKAQHYQMNIRITEDLRDAIQTKADALGGIKIIDLIRKALEYYTAYCSDATKDRKLSSIEQSFAQQKGLLIEDIRKFLSCVSSDKFIVSQDTIYEARAWITRLNSRLDRMSYLSGSKDQIMK